MVAAVLIVLCFVDTFLTGFVLVHHFALVTSVKKLDAHVDWLSETLDEMCMGTSVMKELEKDIENV